MMRPTKTVWGASMMAIAGTWAIAQTALADDAPSSTDTSELEQVTVTAQRRVQNLQNVPISVTSFSGDELTKQQVVSTLDLDRYVPNMFATNNTGPGSANVYYIRGLGQTQSFPTFEPQVGTYVDDIYIARQNANNLSLFGVQQLQVLNGPQGTLFGRNSTGGAIVVTLMKPGKTLGGNVDVSYGGQGDGYAANQLTGRGSVNIPINDWLLTRTSVYGISDAGYVHDVSTGQRLNGTHNMGAREALTILPSADVTWDLSFDYEHNDRANLLNQPGPNGERISYSGFSTTGGALLPYLTGYKSTLGQGAVVATYGAASNIAVSFDSGTLNLITGYRGLDQALAADFAAASLGDLPVNDAVPTGEITLAQVMKNHEITQEAKWTAKVGDALNYTAGLYYLYEQNGNDYGQVLGLGPTLALPLNDQYVRNDTRSEAAYAQADYKITSALTATLGGRLTHEIKDVWAHPDQPGLGYTTADIVAAGYLTHLTTTQFTPRVALQYQIDPSFMVFGSATRGFQGGGWNGLTGANVVDFNDFAPETIWSYETGFRSQPTARLRFNTTFFYEDVKNYQLLSDNPTTRSFDTSNAASLYGYGVEAQLEWRPIDPLTVSTTLSSMKAGYYAPSPLIQAQEAACRAGAAASCDAGIVTTTGALAVPVFTPPLDATVNGSYVLSFPGFSLTPSVTVQFVAKEWFDTANTPGYAASYPEVGGETRPRTLLDAGVTYAPDSTPLTVTAECKNCTMVNYGTADLLGLDYFNPPGSWDMQVGYKF